MINNHQGQAFVEIFLACLVSISVFIGIFAAIYWLSLRIYSSYYLYEGVICNVHSPIAVCEQKTASHISKFPMTKNVHVKFDKKVSRKSYQIHGKLSVANALCKDCRMLEIKDSAYVPKTYR